MLRGEFIRGDGLVIPNNITTFGAGVILERAFQLGVGGYFIGLVNGSPDKLGSIAALQEPVGNGYARFPLQNGSAGWPVRGTLGIEAFVESVVATFTATAAYAIPVNRLMIAVAAGNAQPYVALSSPFPAELIITPATLLANRQFKYRIYWG